MYQETIRQALVHPLQQKVLTGVFRQIINNSRLHVFILKNYHFIEEFGAGQLTKVARLLADSDFKEKLAQHIADEAKHAALFRQRILELGGSPTLTPDEFEVAFFSRFDSYGLGLSEARLAESTLLEPHELIPFLVPLKVEEDFGLLIFQAHLQASNQDVKTQEMLQQIVPDERRHIAYLTEALQRLGRDGYQARIDNAVETCRKNFLFKGLSPATKIRKLLTILDMYPYQPVGRAMRTTWFLLSPGLWLARAWMRRSTAASPL
jgi:bacterioferritin (cytochrome b1)